MRETFHHFLSTLDPAPVRTWSLILTLYGDCVLPRGGELWLKTLSEILNALGIKPNSARAAMRRLERDGYLECHKTGRTSHYALSERAVHLSHHAADLIYRTAAPVSGPGWDVLAIVDAQVNQKALLAEGFRPLMPGVFMRPAQPGKAAPVKAIRLTAQGDDKTIAAALYELEELADRYRAFIDALPVLNAKACTAPPFEAVLLRLGLVHGFRRIVLRDPQLPPTALPTDWPADTAYEAFARTYSSLEPASEAWLDENARNSAGPLAPPEHLARFSFTPIHKSS
ncbi:MAG: PaaX family transcriptional regulator C-terminal domain-containing protein [Pseudomonadota bacterium]